MFKLLKKETCNPGSVQATSEINLQYQNRRCVSFSHLFSFYHIFYHLLYQLADLCRDFLIWNRYPQQYIELITPKGTSDNEADPDGQKEGGRLIYWIKRCPERSTSMEKFIWLLDKKQEEEARYDYTKRRCQNRLRCMSSVTNFIWSYLHQFFDNSHGLKARLKPLKRPFDQYQSHLKAINNG